MTDLDLKSLWQTSAVDAGPAIDLEAVKSRAEAFDKKIKRRNALEWIASAFVVLWFGHDAWHADSSLLLGGNLMIALAAVGISAYLWRNGRVRQLVDPSHDSRGFLAAHAQALQSQAKLLGQAPLWYLGPLAAGLAVLMVARFPAEGRAMGPWLITTGFIVVVFSVIWWINYRAAAKLRTRADALLASLD